MGAACCVRDRGRLETAPATRCLTRKTRLDTIGESYHQADSCPRVRSACRQSSPQHPTRSTHAMLLRSLTGAPTVTLPAPIAALFSSLAGKRNRLRTNHRLPRAGSHADQASPTDTALRNGRAKYLTLAPVCLDSPTDGPGRGTSDGERARRQGSREEAIQQYHGLSTGDQE